MKIDIPKNSWITPEYIQTAIASLSKKIEDAKLELITNYNKRKQIHLDTAIAKLAELNEILENFDSSTATEAIKSIVPKSTKPKKTTVTVTKDPNEN